MGRTVRCLMSCLHLTERRISAARGYIKSRRIRHGNTRVDTRAPDTEVYSRRAVAPIDRKSHAVRYVQGDGGVVNSGGRDVQWIDHERLYSCLKFFTLRQSRRNDRGVVRRRLLSPSERVTYRTERDAVVDERRSPVLPVRGKVVPQPILQNIPFADDAVDTLSLQTPRFVRCCPISVLTPNVGVPRPI